MTLKIYHNPRCSKSRKTLEIIRDAGIEPTIKVEANLALIMYKLVEAGAGVAITEPITAMEMLGHAIEIKPFRPVFSFVPGIAFPAHRPRTKIAQKFATRFRELFEVDFGVGES